VLAYRKKIVDLLEFAGLMVLAFEGLKVLRVDPFLQRIEAREGPSLRGIAVKGFEVLKEFGQSLGFVVG
jgi:hypothetical protein